MNKPMSSEEAVQSSSISIGETLKQHRLNNEWTKEDVADALNLSEYTVSALESDDYSNLPGATFTRGYIRSYASLLGLDESEIMQNLPYDEEHIGAISTTSKSALRRKGKLHSKRRKKGFLLKWLFILFIIAVAISLVSTQLAGLDRNDLAEKLKMPFLAVDEAPQTNIGESSSQTENDSVQALSLFNSVLSKIDNAQESDSSSSNASSKPSQEAAQSTTKSTAKSEQSSNKNDANSTEIQLRLE